MLSLCGVRLVSLQIVEGPTLAAEGQAVRTQRSDVAARRGKIMDATGVVLADSILTYDIAVNQVNIRSYVHYDKEGNVVGRGPAEAARQLAGLLDMDAAELGGLLIGDSTYSYIKRNVDAVTFRQIRALNIFGIEWETVYQRIYPNGNTAASVIGTIDAQGVGSSGIESQYDTLLQGTPGAEAFEIAPNGAVMPGGKKTIVEPTDGGSVTLTLHADLQHVVQKLLDERVNQHNADWGAVVIQDVSTGQVLVMADSNLTEPNRSKVQPVSAVQYAFEPGSVGKVLTFATALDAGVISPTSVFTVPYSIEPPDAGGPIVDFHDHPTEPLTATGILAASFNTGTVFVGEKLSSQQRYDMMRKFGLGEKTGIELPGESSGLLPPASQWVGRDRYVNMFGQAYMISALQQSSIMATLGNGGVRTPPRIVKSWTNADGTVETPEAPEPVQVLSKDTAATVVKMMESVVVGDIGTASTARVDGYRIAMKTGTAEIVVQGDSGLVSTSAGVVPADAPRLAISVVLYKPKSGGVSSWSAVPFFGDITRQAVRILGIPASEPATDLYPTRP
ncbi:penicillin-binding protein 2 [Schaalia sp. ZJ405]|uniref:peptidoglycan D,D-transpeptidase FtsI family protein n=1 Tax=Schaalia sp. ZJ405 TaxID=2709403 RepID=UPI0013EC9E40|nr:penicillin-binding protein 2 [Schaalia sp. ZJ405]QPK82192.1 penicillin-binding protein 2 [Schaalia sp. ZJ405]